MKIPVLQSPKSSLNLILGILILLFVVHSCKKEETIRPLKPLIAESKTWFDTHIASRPDQPADHSLRHSAAKKPIWNKAYEKTISIGQAVIVPLEYSNEIAVLVGENKDKALLKDISYLMMYKNKQGIFQAELVTRIPDHHYWDEGKAAGKDFYGIVMVEDWWGKPIKTFRIAADKKISYLNRPALAYGGSGLSPMPGERLAVADEPCKVISWTNERGMYEVLYVCDYRNNGDGSGERPEDAPLPEHEIGGRNGGESGPPPSDYGEEIPPNAGGIEGGGAGHNPPPPHGSIIRNQVQNPCLRRVVDQVIRTDADDIISKIISNLDEDVLMQISVIDAPETTNFAAAETDLINVPNSNIIMGTITLSTNVLSNSTKEYAVTVFTHEIVHSYLKYIGQNNKLKELEHQKMALQYISPMVNYLTRAFGLSSRDATALSWIGVNDSMSYINSNDFNYSGGSMSKSELENIYRDYVSSQLGESICN